MWSDFLSNTGRNAHKLVHYFPIYERYFKKFVNQSVVFWEIGVCEGGSVQLWKKYLGPYATIVGIDIDPHCSTMGDEQVQIRIGDQTDKDFLQSLIIEFGTPDVVLDDGSHMMEHMRETFAYMYPRLNNNGIYMVEDLSTCYWARFNGGLKREGTFIEICKDRIDEMHADAIPDNVLPPTTFTETTHSINFYHSLVVFEKMQKRTIPYVMKTGATASKPPVKTVPIAPKIGELVPASAMDAMRERVRELNELVTKEHEKAEEVRREMNKLLSSSSWRITAPLRASQRMVMKLLGK